jgi:tryptophan synthase alpha chain
MSLLSEKFAQLKSTGKKALIPYITAGDPHPDLTLDIMHTLVKAGADVIELGIPFTDPMADGPVIQLACERALKHHVSLSQVLGMVKAFKETDQSTPVVLMGYLNPVERMGYDHFVEEAVKAGVDGVLLVDMPANESVDFREKLTAKGIDTVFLIAPTTSKERIQEIASASSGYVYYVSVKGVTGSATLNQDDIAYHVDQIKAASDIPVGVGFGITDAASAKQVALHADGIIVGSVLVNIIAENQQNPEQIHTKLTTLLSSMRIALDELSES